MNWLVIMNVQTGFSTHAWTPVRSADSRRLRKGGFPAGFAGSVLTHAVAISALGAAATGFGLTPCLFLVMSLLLRWVSAWVIAGALALSTAKLWLLPLRDAFSFAVFVASFLGRGVAWRDQLFRVAPGGRMSADGDQAR